MEPGTPPASQWHGNEASIWVLHGPSSRYQHTIMLALINSALKTWYRSAFCFAVNGYVRVSLTFAS